MYIGNNNVEKLYIGDTEVDKVYLGTVAVYEKASPGPNIHLTSDGTGIVFPAGTYTNTDGYGDFRTNGSSGSSQSDSITFDTDITFPSSNEYRLEISNLTSVYPDLQEITVYVGTSSRPDEKSVTITSSYNSNYAHTGNGWYSPKGSHYIPDKTSSSSSYCYGYYDNAYDSGVNPGKYIGQFIFKIGHTIGREIELPQNKILLRFKSSGSTLAYDATNNRLDMNNSYLAVYNTSSNTYVKKWLVTGLDSNRYLGFDFGTDTTYMLSDNEYYELCIRFTTPLSAQYNNSVGGLDTISLYKWGYQVMSPKIVKLGLSGHIMDYSPDFVDKSISLGEDTRNAWNLGYVKFSGTEAGKLVQYSTTPIT